ncbi:MAG TPA: hypothetical protein P5132_04075 [Bacteroidales bacterium]|nr:hypothetical protein [Bacteroidales bacterium]
MKNVINLITALFLCTTLLAQSPEKLSYQAIIRNNSAQLVSNQQVGIQISILQGSTEGTTVYTETHTPTTNTNGLVTLEIGMGETNGDFSLIDWTNGPYFIKTETDPTGGTNYSIIGISQLLSVPYALHAKTVEIINETDPVFTEWDKDYNDLINTPEVWDKDYNDLINKPELWDSSWTSIKNKPEPWDSSWVSIKGKPTGNNIGDMLYWDGSKWITVSQGTPGQYLQLSGSGIPQWNGGPTLATVHTDSVYLIGSSSFTCAGSISSDGGYTISEKGFCWSTSPNPTVLDNRVSCGSGTSPFVKTFTGFNQKTTYYVRAYAKNDNTSYGEEISFTTDTASVSIGDTYLGGIVLYIYQPGDYGHIYGETHGIIISESNINTSIQWNDGASVTTNATYTDLGYAKENTDSIITYQGSGNYAAMICNNLDLNGYDDWYLPTYSELYKIWNNRNIIGFTDWGTSYWSSTEYNATDAKYMTINSTFATSGSANKNLYKAIKAIRYF